MSPGPAGASAVRRPECGRDAGGDQDVSTGADAALDDGATKGTNGPGACERALRGTTPGVNATVLWVIAAIVVIVGIVQLFQGQVIFGIVLIIIGCLIGPGGVSIFNRR
jgi:hypothetical protein